MVKTAICAAVQLVKTRLNQYYSLTDDLQVYTIAIGECYSILHEAFLMNYTVLHLCHKLTYFKQAGWEPSWISITEQLMLTEFECSYATAPVVEVLNVSGDGVCVEKVCIYPLLSFHIVLLMCIQTMNIFDNLPTLAAPKPADIGSELEHYLATEIEHVVDPVQWWHKK